jgi:carbamoyltransferase
VKGEPIVETPRDAMACFINTGIDHLILHDTLVSKTSAHRFVAPLVRTYMDIAGLVSASTR